MREKARILKAAEILEAEYGLSRWEHAKHDPITTLVGTILSQNTSDRNSTPAFNALRKRYPSWEKVLAAPEEDIAETIRRGGLPNIKAKRIKCALKRIKETAGKLSLDFLKNKPKEEVQTFLLSLPGVGWKTASIIMLFSLGIPAFPVDTHIFRVSKRLGFIPNNASLEEAHKILDRSVPDGKKASFHVNLIYLGRDVCHPKKPECERCVLNKMCPSRRKLA